jgi:protein-S-isoprenylcysteine O-methyltransferase Ste14
MHIGNLSQTGCSLVVTNYIIFEPSSASSPIVSRYAKGSKKLKYKIMNTNYIIKHVIGTLFFFSIIFISAGKIDYWQGLTYVSIGLIMGILNYTVLRIDPELLKERSKLGEGTKKWDKAILGLSLLVTIAMYITAGLDSGRYHWSPDFHWSLYGAGIILTMCGQLLFLIAQKQNKFFSSTVRIQTNRGHVVCETGLYKIVRHPAYLGSIIQSLGFPLLFGSLWSILPISLSVILLITRTNMEDKTLKDELRGYLEYSNKTRYRLVPYVW